MNLGVAVSTDEDTLDMIDGNGRPNKQLLGVYLPNSGKSKSRDMVIPSQAL